MSRLPLSKHPILYYKNKWLHHRCKYADAPEGTVVEEFNGVRLPFDLTLGKMVKRMYFGSYEFETIRIMKKYLKPGGVFIDTGANVGYLSAVGASLVGKTGQVYSFEPVPEYYSYVQQIKELNPAYKIVANDVALGETPARSYIANHRRNLGRNSLVPGFVPKQDIAELVEVRVQHLDEYIKTRQLTHISLIKIDTEGFELPVLLGTSRFFEEHRNSLPPVIAEITPHAFELMDRDVCELDEFMSSCGYKSYAICGRHQIDIKKLTKQIDVLFKT